MSKTVAVRVLLDTEGGRVTGIGHVLRSVALAERLQTFGMAVELLAGIDAGPLARAAVHAAGLRAARRPRPDVIVIDRPDTNHQLLLSRQIDWPGVPMVVLDYYGPLVHGVRAVVNLNPGRERSRTPRDNRIVRGLTYATLRPSFARLRARRRGIPARVTRVLVGFGGTDPQGWSADAARLIVECGGSDVQVDVLVGKAPSSAVRGTPRAAGRVRIHAAVTDPASLLHRSDLVVIGGGTMMMEAACLGVPALIVPRTIDERRFTREFVRAGAVRVVTGGPGFPVRPLRRLVSELLGDRAGRTKMAKAGRALVDGRGADRVARLVRRIARGARGVSA